MGLWNGLRGRLAPSSRRGTGRFFFPFSSLPLTCSLSGNRIWSVIHQPGGVIRRKGAGSLAPKYWLAIQGESVPKKKNYEERSDLERIESQWRKLSGLHSREEWSAAVVRAATAAEIAANYAIRKEFKARSKFDAAFVDSLLKWANGLSGKIDHLLLPLLGKSGSAKGLKDVAGKINRIRNDVVHRGEFCSENEAKEVISQSKTFVETLIQTYEPDFKLKNAKD